MLTNLVSRLTGDLPLFVSDELIHYTTILFELFHLEEAVKPTGKRGRSCKPRQIVDPRLNYAIVRKTRSKGHITSINRTIVFGTKSKLKKYLEKYNSNTINTSFIERSNLNFRIWNAHLTRKKPTFT
jgi:hypothetical protein